MFLQESVSLFGGESDHLVRTRKISRCLPDGFKEAESKEKKTGKNTYEKMSIHKAPYRMRKK